MTELLLVLGNVSKEARAAVERQLGTSLPREVKEFGRGAFLHDLNDAPLHMLRKNAGYRPGSVEAKFDLSKVDASYLERYYDLPASSATVVVVETEIYETWCRSDPKRLVDRFPQAVGIFEVRGGTQIARIK
ncbi:MAG TPA: hypothetical protein VFZ48_00845 [Candidatus Saccharimonadales bacterium]